MIFSMVIISPHGYFGQANVLGRPDTGGQVVYILDQARPGGEMRAAWTSRDGNRTANHYSDAPDTGSRRHYL
jgi:hypothetical protein